MNIRLFLRYDGSAYHGWQIQNKNGESHLPTVQGALGEALRTLLGDSIENPSEPIGVSRTDGGVHADMYCASFHTENESIPPERIPYALKQFLPEDITVYKAERVSDDFNPRFDVISKTYKYLFYTSEFAVPTLDKCAWHAPVRHKGAELNLAAMESAAKQLLGTHEFDAFCAAGGSAKTTDRTIFDIRVEKLSVPLIVPPRALGADENETDFSMYALYVEGDGFLYNMVRIIAGTVLYAGLGKIKPEEIPEIIASKNRKRAGITAPAHGLYLHSLKYPY